MRETSEHGFTFVTGTSGANTVVMMQCGIGKVNAAMGAAELISLFGPDAVISTGVAGGASVQLERMEVVVSSQTCYHDVYCGSEQAYGQIPGLPARFDADSGLLRKACDIDCGTKITPGLIVTGDWFVDSREKMAAILDVSGGYGGRHGVGFDSASVSPARREVHQLPHNKRHPAQG